MLPLLSNTSIQDTPAACGLQRGGYKLGDTYQGGANFPPVKAVALPTNPPRYLISPRTQILISKTVGSKAQLRERLEATPDILSRSPSTVGQSFEVNKGLFFLGSLSIAEVCSSTYRTRFMLQSCDALFPAAMCLDSNNNRSIAIDRVTAVTARRTTNDETLCWEYPIVRAEACFSLL